MGSGLAGARRGLDAVPFTRLGWWTTLVGVAAWWAGARLGWVELLTLAAGCLLLASTGLLWTLRKPVSDVAVRLTRERVVVGEEAVAQLRVHNPSRRGRGSTRVEVPIGASIASFEAPALPPGGHWEDTIIIPTSRRCVVAVGPPRGVTGDPLAVARREVVTGERVELFVHPITVRLPSLTSGWMRDLEGQTTNDLSNSDVAFHTLREYVPGDDRRHIHWRSSARIGALMVRQFVDTRRSHLGLTIPLHPDDWDGQEEFELGVSVTGSLGRTALTEEQEVTGVAGAHALAAPTAPLLLDALSRIDPHEAQPRLPDTIRAAVAWTKGASIVVLVVGSTVDVVELRRHAERFGPHVRVVVVRCQLGAEVRRDRLGRMTVLHVGDLASLARVLQVGVLA